MEVCRNYGYSSSCKEPLYDYNNSNHCPDKLTKATSEEILAKIDYYNT